MEGRGNPCFYQEAPEKTTTATVEISEEIESHDFVIKLEPWMFESKDVLRVPFWDPDWGSYASGNGLTTPPVDIVSGVFSSGVGIGTESWNVLKNHATYSATLRTHDTGLELDLWFTMPDKIDESILKMKRFKVETLYEEVLMSSSIHSFPSSRLKGPHPSSQYRKFDTTLFLRAKTTRVGGKKDVVLVDTIRITWNIGVRDKKVTTENSIHTSSLKDVPHPLFLQPDDDGEATNKDNGEDEDERPVFSMFLSDVVLICEGKEFPAHRIILSMASPFFKKMFEVSMSESLTSRVTIGDVDSPTLSLILRWIYREDYRSSNLRRLTVTKVIGLFKGSHLYLMETLKNWCEGQLVVNTHDGNAISMYVLADKYQAVRLLRRAMGILKTRKRIVFKDQEVYTKFLKEHPNLMHQLFVER